MIRSYPFGSTLVRHTTGCPAECELRQDRVCTLSGVPAARPIIRVYRFGAASKARWRAIEARAVRLGTGNRRTIRSGFAAVSRASGSSVAAIPRAASVHGLLCAHPFDSMAAIAGNHASLVLRKEALARARPRREGSGAITGYTAFAARRLVGGAIFSDVSRVPGASEPLMAELTAVKVRLRCHRLDSSGTGEPEPHARSG